MPCDQECALIGHPECLVAIGRVGFDNGNDFGRIAAESRLADHVIRLDQRDRHEVRRQGRAVIGVVHPLQRGVLSTIDLKDRLPRAIQPGLVVAHR